MMDYYEELGVDRSASSEEIRQAYKRLVWLLHPDHCSDDAVRPLADLQMKRLNGVLQILTNPAERETYDRAVFGHPPPRELLAVFPAPPLPPTPRRTPVWFWRIAGGATLLVMVVLLAYTPPAPPSQMAVPDQPSPAPPEPKKPTGRGPGVRAQGVVPAATSPGHLIPHPALEQSPAPEPDLSPPTSSPPVAVANNAAESPVTTTMGEAANQISEIALPALPVLEPAKTPSSPRLSGVWLLVRSSHPKADGLYPPEYIELRLTEDSGILRGRYQARYHIPDQAIPPTVAFQFEGRASADRASLPWVGAGGARGEIRVRLVTPGTLEVVWVANQLSAEVGLISGTATLVRKLD